MRITLLNDLRADAEPSAITLLDKANHEMIVIHNYTMEIPTVGGCVVEVPMLSADQYRKAVRAIIHYTTAPNTIETGISSIM